jgi:hypothetical protein
MSPEPLDGRDFRALRRVSDAENETLAAVGETCERVPTESLPALLESGDIERAVERRAPAADSSSPAPDDATSTRRKARR